MVLVAVSRPLGNGDAMSLESYIKKFPKGKKLDVLAGYNDSHDRMLSGRAEVLEIEEDV